MSTFRTEVDISFDKEDHAIAFLNLLRDIQSKMFKGKGDEEISIISKCRYHECFHDEKPPKPCGGYVNFDYKNPIADKIKNKKGEVIEASELTKGVV